MTRKESIRAEMRARRAALTKPGIQQASARIQRAVMKLPEWAAARRVCVYLALPTEVQTCALLAACWKTGKQVLVPAYRKNVLCYDLARIRPDDPVKAGHWAVPEPTRPRWVTPARVDLVVIPGLAFDRTGGRLGHGLGYYDRLLAGTALKQAFKVGLALECQMVARVPMNARDIRLDAVVTERAVYRRQKNGRQTYSGGAQRGARCVRGSNSVSRACRGIRKSKASSGRMLVRRVKHRTRVHASAENRQAPQNRRSFFSNRIRDTWVAGIARIGSHKEMTKRNNRPGRRGWRKL